jgi:ribosome-associated translation inhibitor RaiA
MRLNIYGRGVAADQSVRNRVERRLAFALGRFGMWIERATVRLSDSNGPRGGVDKHCRIVVDLRGHGAVVVEDADRDLNVAVDRACDRVGQAVGRRLEKRRSANILLEGESVIQRESRF